MAAAFELEQKISIPEARSGLKKYPLADMKVNDSFFVKIPEKDRRNKQNSVLACAIRLKPKKFTTRKTKGGFRVWRIK